MVRSSAQDDSANALAMTSPSEPPRAGLALLENVAVQGPKNEKPGRPSRLPGRKFPLHVGTHCGRMMVAGGRPVMAK